MLSEQQVNSLLAERERLLNAWQTADEQQKVAILVRIDDIDDELSSHQNKPVTRAVRPRRFYRR